MVTSFPDLDDQHPISKIEFCKFYLRNIIEYGGEFELVKLFNNYYLFSFKRSELCNAEDIPINQTENFKENIKEECVNDIVPYIRETHHNLFESNNFYNLDEITEWSTNFRNLFNKDAENKNIIDKYLEYKRAMGKIRVLLPEDPLGTFSQTAAATAADEIFLGTQTDDDNSDLDDFDENIFDPEKPLPTTTTATSATTAEPPAKQQK